MKRTRLVIDTNIWINYLFGATTNQLLKRVLQSNKFVICTSHELRNEILTTIKRPKFKKFITNDIILKFTSYFDYKTQLIEVNSKVDVCRDFNDNFLLSLCKDCKSDYLITSDKDLLSIENFENTIILNLTKFVTDYL